MLAWPLTGSDRYPADTPVGHLRNGLQVARLHRQVFGVAEREREAWASLEARIELALAGLEQLERAGYVVEPPRNLHSTRGNP